MAETKREIERKYDVGADVELPDLTGVAGIADVVHKGVVELDATYWDTSDQRLAASSVTLRHRTGGDDAGWHLKLPVALAEGCGTRSTRRSRTTYPARCSPSCARAYAAPN
ncbi:CYTH domain-containing protein [Streptomyces rectiviolaceus]|uniref:CYTH domain-containing protein n=1 Tax=Streptomyces rectiviolaceus TaxID=332591 RepID=UPI00363B7482